MRAPKRKGKKMPEGEILIQNQALKINPTEKVRVKVREKASNGEVEDLVE